MAATNANGTGPEYSLSAWVTPAGLPAAPTISSVKPGMAQVKVTFAPPVSNGGSPITSYIVTSNPGQKKATGASSPITVLGLTNGTAYAFTVKATNAIGTGPESGPSAKATPASPPGAPTNVKAEAINGAAMVSFTPPASDGGSPITGYTVFTGTSTGLQDHFAKAKTSPVKVTGLTNGTPYTFKVKAENAVGGVGPASQPSNPVTP